MCYTSPHGEISCCWHILVKIPHAIFGKTTKTKTKGNYWLDINNWGYLVFTSWLVTTFGRIIRALGTAGAVCGDSMFQPITGTCWLLNNPGEWSIPFWRLQEDVKKAEADSEIISLCSLIRLMRIEKQINLPLLTWMLDLSRSVMAHC